MKEPATESLEPPKSGQGVGTSWIFLNSPTESWHLGQGDSSNPHSPKCRSKEKAEFIPSRFMASKLAQSVRLSLLSENLAICFKAPDIRSASTKMTSKRRLRNRSWTNAIASAPFSCRRFHAGAGRPTGSVRREFFANDLSHHFESRPPVHIFQQRIVDQGLIISPTRLAHDVSEELEDSIIQAN